MPPTAKATINLTAIGANLEVVKQLAPHSKVMAVVKANAYGHGLMPVATALAAADGLAVTELEEALTLRQTKIAQRILLLGGTLLDESAIVQCAKQSIDILAHDLSIFRIIRQAKICHPLAIWLKLDTGMHRLGFNQNKLIEVLNQARQSRLISKIILMTHFSSADDPNSDNTKKQIDQLLDTNAMYAMPVSMANSAAIMRYPDSHGDWVRPGIMLYGANPLQHSDGPMLQSAMTLTAPVLAIRTIKQGEGVVYNHQWICPKDTQVATVGIGYSDGYPFSAKNGTPVLVGGQRACLVGSVSMDMITIDIGQCRNVRVGDEVTLWGKDLPVEEVARHANTISYVLLSGLSAKLPRIYTTD